MTKPKKSSKNPTQYFAKKPQSDLTLKKVIRSIRNHLCTFQIASGVFGSEEIDKGTLVLIENLTIPSHGPVLDLGAGYGPIAISVYKELSRQQKTGPLMNLNTSQNIEVYASEVNERAAWLLARNAVLNDCKPIKILKGDFQNHIASLKANGITFNAVYSNPPLKMGHDVMITLFSGAIELLSDHGFVQYVHKKSLGAEAFMAKLKDLFPLLSIEVLIKQNGYYVIQLKKDR